MKINLEETLAKIKVLLNTEAEEVTVAPVEDVVEVALEQQTLVDAATVIEAEVFEAKQSVFIVTDGGNIPLPIGNYELADERILVVEVEGIIASIGEAPAPEEEFEETETIDPNLSIIADLRTQLEDTVASNVELQSQIDLSVTTISGKDSEIETLNVELSKLPASKKLSHSQETLDFIEKSKNTNSGKGNTRFSKILNNIQNNK